MKLFTLNALTKGALKTCLLILCINNFAYGQYSETRAGNSFVNKIFSGSSPSWSNLSNLQSNDSNEASVILSSNGMISDYLVITDFGFNFPSSATIEGFEVIITKHSTTPGQSSDVRDETVKLILRDTLRGENQALSGYWPLNKSSFTYGSSSNPWDTTLTVDDMADSTFGIAINVRKVGGGQGGGHISRAYIDHITITVHSDSYVLPVELVYFKGKWVNRNNIDLEWATASEFNSNHFTVMRSYDGENFDSIAFIDAIGNSQNKVTYQFTDHLQDHFHSGTLYYMLKQTDLDGTEEIFNIVKLTEPPRVIPDPELIFPNPSTFNDGINLFIDNGNSMPEIHIDVTTMTGNPVFYENIHPVRGGTFYSFYPELPPGLYMINIKINGRQTSDKIIYK